MDSDDDVEDKVPKQTNNNNNESFKHPADTQVTMASKQEILNARKRRTDARIGDASENVKEVSGVRAKKTRKLMDGDEVIDEVEGEEEAIAEEESYIVDGQSVDIEPFNLKEERKAGYFDAEGHFVEKGFNADKLNDDDVNDDNEDNQHADPWLSEMADWEKHGGQQEMDKVRQAHAAQLQRAQQAEFAKPINVTDALSQLSKVLLKNETVTKAMQRLRPQKRKIRKKHEKKQEKTEEEKQNETNLNIIMEQSNELLGAGCSDVFTMTLDEIEDWIEEDSKKPKTEELLPEANALVWHYRMNVADTQLKGPFTTAQMKAWHDQGFFKPDSDVLIRVRHPDDKITGFQPVARIDWKKYWGGH